jgi:hypothetical protein
MGETLKKFMRSLNIARHLRKRAQRRREKAGVLAEEEQGSESGQEDNRAVPGEAKGHGGKSKSRPPDSEEEDATDSEDKEQAETPKSRKSVWRKLRSWKDRTFNAESEQDSDVASADGASSASKSASKKRSKKTGKLKKLWSKAKHSTAWAKKKTVGRIWGKDKKQVGGVGVE